MEIQRIVIEANKTGASCAYDFGSGVTGTKKCRNLHHALSFANKVTRHNGWLEFFAILAVGILVGYVAARS